MLLCTVPPGTESSTRMCLESRYRFTGNETQKLKQNILWWFRTRCRTCKPTVPCWFCMAPSFPTWWFCTRHLLPSYYGTWWFSGSVTGTCPAPTQYFQLLSSYECCGSGFVGSVCFWTSRILPSTSKQSKKNLYLYYFVTFFTFYR
jgi:hypothetical protein